MWVLGFKGHTRIMYNETPDPFPGLGGKKIRNNSKSEMAPHPKAKDPHTKLVPQVSLPLGRRLPLDPPKAKTGHAKHSNAHKEQDEAEMQSVLTHLITLCTKSS